MNTRFDIFISYARRDDSEVVAGRQLRPVTELKEALESHSHPETGAALRVCTDVEDFDLGGAVEAAIRDKVRASHGHVVICTEQAVASEWVLKELAWFAEDRPGGPRVGVAMGLLPSAAFPAWFSPKHLGADLGRVDSESLESWHRRVLGESHKIAASIWGLPLTLVHNRWQAEVRARISAELARKSRTLLATESDRAAVSALAAHAASPTAEAVTALFNVARLCHRLACVDPGRRIADAGVPARFTGNAYKAAISADGGAILLLRRDNALIVRSADGTRERFITEVDIPLWVEPRVAISGDQRFAAVSEGDSLRLFSLDDRTERRVRPSATMLGAFALDPAGRVLVAGDADGVVRAFSLADGGLLWEGGQHVRTVEAVVFSDDGRVVATLNTRYKKVGTLRLWNAATGRALRVESLDEGIRNPSAVFTADGSHCIVSREDKRVALVPVNKKRKTRWLFTGLRGLPVLASARNGRFAAAAGGQIAVWGSLDADGPETFNSPLGAPIVYLTFAPDPSLLVAADESGAFAVIDVVRQSTVVGPIRAYEGLAAAPAVARDRHELVAVHSDGTVTIWDLAPAPVLGPCAYSWDGRRIASLHDSAVFIWDAVGLQPVGAPLAWPGARPGAVAFVPDGSTLAVALDDRTVRLWDMNAATEGRALTGPGQSLPAEGGRWRVQSWQVGVAPSGQAIAAWVNFAGEGPGQWDEVWVWDPSSGAADLVTSSKGDLCGIGWIDGDTLLVARIGALRLWSVLRKELTWRGDFEEFEAVFAIGTAPAALTPTWTVSHENREVVVWTGSAVAGERYRIQGERVSPTISADGSRLVWAEGGSIVIWSLLLRSQVGGGLPYDAPLTACYFSPFDGALLVVSGGGRAERWTTEPEAVRRLVCSLAARAPNEEERSDFGGLDLDLECLESGENLIVPADWSRQDPIGTREARALKDCGLTLAERRLYKEALESLDRAAVLAPADAQVQHHRGVVLIALGSLVAAVHAFDRALALRPDLESTRTAQAHALAVLKGNEKASATSVGRRARRRPSLIPDARAGRRP